MPERTFIATGLSWLRVFSV